MSNRELLIDIVSYYTPMAGISPCTPVDDYARIIGTFCFYTNLIKVSSLLTTQDLTLLLCATVNY